MHEVGGAVLDPSRQNVAVNSRRPDTVDSSTKVENRSSADPRASASDGLSSHDFFHHGQEPAAGIPLPLRLPAEAVCHEGFLQACEALGAFAFNVGPEDRAYRMIVLLWRGF